MADHVTETTVLWLLVLMYLRHFAPNDHEISILLHSYISKRIISLRVLYQSQKHLVSKIDDKNSQHVQSLYSIIICKCSTCSEEYFSLARLTLIGQSSNLRPIREELPRRCYNEHSSKKNVDNEWRKYGTIETLKIFSFGFHHNIYIRQFPDNKVTTDIPKTEFVCNGAISLGIY